MHVINGLGSTSDSDLDMTFLQCHIDSVTIRIFNLRQKSKVIIYINMQYLYNSASGRYKNIKIYLRYFCIICDTEPYLSAAMIILFLKL